jgi:hypothetical protein
MTGVGPYAWQIGRRFEMAARRLGLNTERRQLRTDLFKATPAAPALPKKKVSASSANQLSLF